MLEKNFNLLFYLKRPKNYNNGPIPVYLRITVDGLRTEIATARSCEPERWNSHSGRANGTKEDIKSLNSFLDTLQLKVFEVRRISIESNTQVTSTLLKNILRGETGKPKMILEIYQEHNDRFAELVGKEFSLATLLRYKISLEHTRNFILLKYHRSDLELTALDYDFIASYVHWLKTIRNCCHNTTAKYIANFRKIVYECLKQGWLQRDPFLGFKLTQKEVKKEILSMKEIELMTITKFQSKRLEQIRDIFLFCCYTGLAYIDIKNLKRTDIKIGIDGEDWIFTSRQKTDVDTRIPLLPFAKNLVEKYRLNTQCIIQGSVLPVPCNQKMNVYIKEVADICGIEKALTSHIARHTFATTITLSNGVPIETVSKLLGHTNLRTTQHYAKILDMKVSSDIQTLKNKLKIN